MSEIEKMYENAGVEYEERYNNCTLNKEGDCELKCSCDICKYSEEKYIYPPFTAEKQIELIKWLAIRFNSDYMSYWHNEIKDVWIFRLNDLTEFSSEEPCIYEGRNKYFTEALCNLINDLWQSLTPEEKQQVKGILE